MGYRTTIQIALIIISVVIIATYVNPEFKNLKATQDETAEYREALDNASSFQAELERQQVSANNLTVSQRRSLDTYLPTSVDAVSVMRDISLIVGQSKMQLLAIMSGADDETEDQPRKGVSVQGQEAEMEPEPVTVNNDQFTVEVSGSYEQFKELLRALERNHYPLELVAATFSTGEGSLLTFSLVLETYSLTISE